jgi:hypothetical protein
MLTRDQLLGLKPEIKQVQIPDLGESVYIRQVDVGTRNRIEADVQKNGTTDLRQKVAAAVLCDGDGNALFQYDEHRLLDTLPAYVLDAVFDEANKLNKLGDEEVEAEKKAEGRP